MIDGKSFIVEELKEEPLDIEIEKLVYLINQVDGVETFDSCFGHHKMPCRIWLRIKDADTANKFIRRFFYFDPLWNLKLAFSEARYFDELLFVLESAYQDYPTVDLMIENITKRFEEGLESKEETRIVFEELIMTEEQLKKMEELMGKEEFDRWILASRLLDENKISYEEYEIIVGKSIIVLNKN